MKLLMKGAIEAAPVQEDSPVAIDKSNDRPLNVILLLVDELYRSDVPAYLENRDEFPVRGHLETCPAVAGHTKGDVSCDCDQKLGSSIVSLISWAERTRNMSISDLYKISPSLSDSRARLIYGQRRDALELSQTEPTSQGEKTKMPLKFKNTIFGSLVDGLRKTQLRAPTIVHLSDVKKLSFKENQRGHLVIMHVEVDELGNVLEHLKHYVSPSNTLTIVMNSCPQDRTNLVPYFAGGSGAEQLAYVGKLEYLQNLPSAIPAIIGQPAFAKMEKIYYDNNERRKRQDAPADDSGQEAITHSTLMIIAVVTATITRAFKL
ncbi:uncharacterized protein LOC131675764 [Phymastichus coffea]|uniref:uncharacterized protein LOC131675764 n=1 Tax=Phymastichus coffea TaxID=108790 RepID=UPI00273B803C|nr:uncharacterized protein LOC131675764 [Phymastichus coffea]